jgi:hypothetical protein
MGRGYREEFVQDSKLKSERTHMNAFYVGLQCQINFPMKIQGGEFVKNRTRYHTAGCKV